MVSRRAVLVGAAAAGGGLVAAPLAAVASLFADDEAPRPALEASDAALADIPGGLLAVYTAAAAARCPGLPWTVLAAIGKVESGHDPTAIGPPLDGSPGAAAIPATAQGTAWHGDSVWERAVGMMQFLPATFRAYGVAADGVAPDPFDPADAAHSAAAYLCANGAGDPSRLRDALFAYNRAGWYVEQVLAQAAEYSATASAPPAAAGAVTPDYVAVALAQLGKPYRWGAAGPDAFDCSGLTSWSLAQLGVTIPRVSADQARFISAYGHSISVPAAAGVYGALVFRIGVGAVNHVVISLGDGRTLEAWRTGEPVQVKRLTGRQWTSAGLVPGLTYRTAPDTGADGIRSGVAALAGIAPLGRTVTRPVAGTGAGTATETVGRPLVGTQPATGNLHEGPGQRRTRGVAGDRHPSRPRRRRSAVPAEAGHRVDTKPQHRTTGEANDEARAEGAPNGTAAGGGNRSAYGMVTALVAPWTAAESTLDARWGQLRELAAGIIHSASQTLAMLGYALILGAVLALGWLVVRHVATRRALRPHRRVRLTVLPTETFDPSDEEVARYAAQLSRTRRTVRGPGRPAQAVRVRLDSTGEGQCAYRIEGAPQAASILTVPGYDETELRPTDGLDPADARGALGTAAPPDTAEQATEPEDTDRETPDAAAPPREPTRPGRSEPEYD